MVGCRVVFFLGSTPGSQRLPASGNEIDAAGNVIASGGVRLEDPRTRTKFPFHTSSAKKLNVTNPPIITVVDKAFFDIGHSLKDQSKKLEKASSWLRCMGDSSGDETNSSMIRVYNKAGNVIEAHEHAGEFKAW